MERVWHHTFYNELLVAPEEHAVLLTEAPLNPSEKRERTAQIMFETFRVPALHLAVGPLLTMLASNRTTGLALECGDATTYVVPVHEACVLTCGIKRLDFGGRDLTEHLMKLLTERGYPFHSSADRAIASHIKERLAFVALHPDEKRHASSMPLEQFYELPDGQVLSLASERYKCVEALFQPSLIGKEGPGIHAAAFSAISSSSADIQNELYRTIVLGGGTALLAGIEERVQREIAALTPSAVKIHGVSQRKYSAWAGGAMMASMASFRDMCVSKQEYDEIGPAAIDRIHMYRD